MLKVLSHLESSFVKETANAFVIVMIIVIYILE